MSMFLELSVNLLCKTMENSRYRYIGIIIVKRKMESFFKD